MPDIDAAAFFSADCHFFLFLSMPTLSVYFFGFAADISPSFSRLPFFAVTYFVAAAAAVSSMLTLILPLSLIIIFDCQFSHIIFAIID
jgi:hypothetical protein